MANITDTNAIRFCNTRVRPVADRIAQLYNAIIAIGNEYTALGISTLIPNDSSPIADGAATDGRPQIVGTDVANIVTIVTAIKTTLEATSNQKLNQVLRVGVNTLP